MPSASALRFQIETALEQRIPGALTPRPRVLRDLAPTGISHLDTLLEGGLPIGAISEFVGSLSAGRSSLAMAALAQMTKAGKTVAWVDANDALDPESAAAAGIDLSRQLWVRCGPSSIPHKPLTTSTPNSTTPALLAEGSRTPAPSGGGGSPHPRGEARGLSQAVGSFLQTDTFARPLAPRHHYNLTRKNRTIGTPGASNRPLRSTQSGPGIVFPRCAPDREEQIPTDRLPPRRGTNFKPSSSRPKDLKSSQIALTANAHTWTDNRNNAAGRSLQSALDAIAAGLPRFSQMEAGGSGQGHGLDHGPFPWKPSPHTPVHQATAQHSSQIVPIASHPHQTSAQKPTSRPSLAGDPPPRHKRSVIWQSLNQALRATDLLLAAGGFSAIVLDLGSTPPEFAWRIPLATWFRFRTAADRARTVLILLTQHPCARSSAELVLRLQPIQPTAAGTVLTGANFHVSIDRRRFDSEVPAVAPEPISKLHLITPRKHPQRETSWNRPTAWTRTNSEQSPKPLQ